MSSSLSVVLAGTIVVAAIHETHDGVMGQHPPVVAGLSVGFLDVAIAAIGEFGHGGSDMPINP